jgi:phenylacetate-CoA ligase
MRARPNDGRRFLVATTSSSGSTGRPVRVEKFADIHNPLYVATSLIDHAWHRRDLNAEVAVITDVRDGSQLGWGPRLAAFGLKGKAHMRNMIRHPPEHLLEWLAGLRPTYLITTPSMAKRLAEVALAGNRSVGPIRQVITYAEVVSDECRTLCRAAFGAQVTDRYSCEEIGWIALQCPKHEHYHVMSGTVVCEIVDDAGAPCRPGETGRVLLTSLHSYGMPVIRYDIGDVAERGSPCDCGINLPVIKRILGRERSFIRLPDGSTRLARLTGEYWRQIAPVKEYRVVQYADGLIEAFVVCERALTEAERQAMVQMLQKVFEHPFEVIITETEMIDWGSRTKRLDILRLNRNRDGSLPAQAIR